MQLAAALPLGCESTCEMLDIFVMGEVSPEQMTDRLRAAVPEGLEVFRIEVVDLNGPALQTLIRAAVYEIVLSEPVTARGLQAQITEMLSQPAIERTRRGKVYDLRPLIRSLAVESRGAEAPVILAEVVFSQHEGTGRPDEIISALGFDPLAARITRVKLALGDS
jgi:radical SAM-linked protein